MIASYKELRFYIMADRMMNRGYFTPPPPPEKVCSFC